MWDGFSTRPRPRSGRLLAPDGLRTRPHFRGTSVALRGCVARFLALLAFATSAFALDAPVATILAYHEVDPPSAAHSTIPRGSATGDAQSEMLRYTVTPESFEAQLDYLQSNGYHVIPLADLVDFLSGARPALPPRAVVITVDDGWLCAYTNMLPALSRRGMPFTVFVYPKIVG